MATDVEKASMVAALKTLNAQDQKEVATAAGILSPGQRTSNNIWMLIVGAFVIVLLASFATFAIATFSGSKSDLLLAVFTTAAGFLTGLVSPSPVATGKAA